MNVMVFLGVITCVSSLLLLLVGYLISFKQKLNLINGVDFSTLSDVSAYAKFIGNSIVLMGLLMLLIGVAAYLNVIGLVAYTLAILLICVIPLPVLVMAKRKFTKS